MVSNRIITSRGALFAIIYLAISSSATSVILRRSSSLPLSSSDDKVELALYYESLCPYSANFVVNYLANIFTNGLIDIVDLKLVPWGNAKISSNGTFKCQHGPDECLLDTVEACAINVWPEVSKHFPLINCIEKLVYAGGDYETQWMTCFDTVGLDLTPVAKCRNDGQGKKLELLYANETSLLVPPHEYVPWVVVDGQPLYERYEEFITFVCKAYKGNSTLPSVCNGSSSSTYPAGSLLIREKVDQVTYPDDDDDGDDSEVSDSLVKSIQYGGESWLSWMLKVLDL